MGNAIAIVVSVLVIAAVIGGLLYGISHLIASGMERRTQRELTQLRSLVQQHETVYDTVLGIASNPNDPTDSSPFIAEYLITHRPKQKEIS